MWQGIHSVTTIESSSDMASVLVRCSSNDTDEIMARRLKNRERQRRYRARKRLEEDIKRSSMVQRCAWLPNEQEQQQQQQLCVTATEFGNKQVSQSNASVNSSSDRVHCSRKWKKDARQAHLFRNPENLPNKLLHSVKTMLESGSTVKTNKTSSTRRRDWKAEARSKSKTDIGTSEYGLQN